MLDFTEERVSYMGSYCISRLIYWRKTIRSIECGVTESVHLLASQSFTIHSKLSPNYLFCSWSFSKYWFAFDFQSYFSVLFDCFFSNPYCIWVQLSPFLLSIRNAQCVLRTMYNEIGILQNKQNWARNGKQHENLRKFQ